MSDTALRYEGMNLLLKGLGSVEAERFITMIIHDNINYTEWRRDGLDELESIEELSKTASEYFAKMHPELV